MNANKLFQHPAQYGIGLLDTVLTRKVEKKV